MALADILFITPPIWDVNSPFLAVPLLMAVVKTAGGSCAQMDLNVTAFADMYDHRRNRLFEKFLTKEYYDERVVPWKNSPVNTYEEYLQKINFLRREKLELSELKRIFLKGGMLERGIIGAIRDDVVRMFSPSRPKNIFTIDESMPLHAIEIIERCFNRHPELTVRIENAKLIGVSVTGVAQLPYAIELIVRIRKAHPAARIVIGGSAVSLIAKCHSNNVQRLLEFCDYIVIGDGETAITMLADLVLRGGQESALRLENIPGLLYRDGGNIRTNPPNTERNMSSIPAPCFDGLDLNAYFLPEPLIPYQASRGCFYGQCAFCNHDPDYRHHYRENTAEKVVDDLLKIVSETGSRNIQLVDEAIEPEFFSELVCAMDDNPAFERINWYCYLRVSSKYSQKIVKLAQRNGLRLVMFGVETLQQRMLKFIKKGIVAGVAKNNLKLFHENGISTFAWLMHGLPSETEGEAREDAEMIADVSDYLDGCSSGRFLLHVNTDMIREPKKYNILSINSTDGYNFVHHYMNEPIDTKAVCDAYMSVMKPLRREKYFSTDRFVLFYEALRKGTI